MPDYRIGPCYAFEGDFLDNSGAFTDVTYLGTTRGDTRVLPQMAIARSKVDQLGAAPVAEGIFLGGIAPMIEIPFVDEDKTKLSKLFPGSSVVTSGSKQAIRFPTVPQKLANASVRSLMLVPVKATYDSNLPFNDNGIWFFPAVVPIDVAEFIYGEIASTDDGLRPHTTQLVACHRTLFADDSTAVPSTGPVATFGDPAQTYSTGFDWATNALTRFNALIAS